MAITWDTKPTTPSQPAPAALKPLPTMHSSGITWGDSASIPTSQTQSSPVHDPLSDMPGLLGAVGSGIYNAGKGLIDLGGTAAHDVFNAVNHPINSAKAIGDFLGGELTGQPVKTDSVGNLIQSTVGSKGLLGVAQLPGKVAFSAMNPKDKNAITPGNALGTSLNGALTALTFGTGNIAANAVEQAVAKGYLSSTVGQALKTAATSQLGTAVQSGGIMTGFNAASNLQEGRPIGEGAKQAFFAGAALPTVVKATGAVANKVIPSSLTPEAGATALKKAIGFRGNAKEKTQYDNAAPVVYNALKESGFKLSDSTDPNNIISLDKAVHEQMTNLLTERTARIKATGGDAFVSGDIAAQKIRNLVEPGSIEDLTNPALRERLDAIASNFEGKQYSPVEAQKAIIQANTGFSFSDNPQVGKQIKMAISQAFTPELDRIVGGADQIKYDAKGKPIPVKGGTAELSKKWSALKTFSDQLQKKMIIEERKAINDLPTRLTGADAAGHVIEGVANPPSLLGKVARGSAELIANKILGDRNNVNYRIYQAFNRQPIGEAIVNLLNRFTQVSDLVKLLEQNPLIQNVLEKIYPPESTLQANENPAAMLEHKRGFVALSPKSDPLLSEAKKYSSAEEFVKKNTLYRSGELRDGRKALMGDWFSTTEDYARAYSERGDLKSYFIKPDAKILQYKDLPANMKPYPSGTLHDFKDIQELQNKAFNYANKNGYDAVTWGGREVNIINRDILIPKSQLTDLWKKAHNK